MQTAIEQINQKASQLYESLVDEEDARVCTDISEDACRYVPFNFFLMILTNTLTKLGKELSNPKTVLATGRGGADLSILGMFIFCSRHFAQWCVLGPKNL